MKRTVPFVIASVTGFVLIVAYFIPYTQSWGDDSMIWFDILASIAPTVWLRCRSDRYNGPRKACCLLLYGSILC